MQQVLVKRSTEESFSLMRANTLSSRAKPGRGDAENLMINLSTEAGAFSVITVASQPGETPLAGSSHTASKVNRKQKKNKEPRS